MNSMQLKDKLKNISKEKMYILIHYRLLTNNFFVNSLLILKKML